MLGVFLEYIVLYEYLCSVFIVTVELILTSALAEKGNKLAAAKSALYPSESEDDSG